MPVEQTLSCYDSFPSGGLAESPQDAECRVRTNRARRCLVFAPTAASALVLSACLFLPFGLYGGCTSAPPQPVSPYQQQREAIESGDVGSLVWVSHPYALSFALGLGTLAASFFGGSGRFLGLWVLHAALIVSTSAALVAACIEWPWGSRTLLEYWHQHGVALLSVFWLLNIVHVSWIEPTSRFAGAMLLQCVIILLIWLGLAQWLLFLEAMLCGGWITAACAGLLPLGTGLQLFGDPAACRESACRADHGNVAPQFTLRGLAAITFLLAILLTTAQAWSLEAAMLLGYIGSFALLALWSRSVRGMRKARYAVTALVFAAGGWLAI
jgi:hypothetical protein